MPSYRVLKVRGTLAQPHPPKLASIPGQATFVSPTFVLEMQERFQPTDRAAVADLRFVKVNLTELSAPQFDRNQ